MIDLDLKKIIHKEKIKTLNRINNPLQYSFEKILKGKPVIVEDGEHKHGNISDYERGKCEGLHEAFEQITLISKELLEERAEFNMTLDEEREFYKEFQVK